jgi:hypothetical protein
MAELDPKVEAAIEAKVVEINKLDMKLHVAKRELFTMICDALCYVLPKESEVDEISKAARSIKAYKLLDSFDKRKVIKLVYCGLNNI